MKYLIYILAIIFLLSANVGVFSSLKIFGSMPNLLLLLVLVASLDSESYDFFFIAMVCGIFTDSFSGLMFGTFTLSFLFTGSLLYFLNNKIVLPTFNWKYLTIVVFVFSLLFQYFVLFFSFLEMRMGLISILPDTALKFSSASLNSLYSLAFFYPVYMLYEKIKSTIIKINQMRRPV